MGASLSITELNSKKTYPPHSKLVSFSQSMTAVPGDLVTYFQAKPPSYELPRDTPADHLFWWTAIDFVPFQDNQLYASVGAYIHKPGRIPIKASHMLQGLIYKWTFNDDKHEIELLRGSRTSALPNVSVHPSGRSIVYIGVSTIHIMNMHTMRSHNRERSGRNNNFQHTAISPNGFYIAYMARTSHNIELGVILIDQSGYLAPINFIFCNTICPGCVSDRTYTDRYYCKFSADSLFIAASTSYGHLLIVNRNDLSLHCSVSPGIVEWGVDNMTNERSFDFDPRYGHERIAFGSVKKVVHFCDIDEGTIEQIYNLDDGEIQCLKFAPRGHCLAVACSSGVVNILNSDTGDCMVKLDGTTVQTEAAISMVNGYLAEALYMTFTSICDVIAVSHTDGIVRLWKLPPIINLQSMCKLTLLKYVHISQLHKLPIPGKVLQEMTYIYDM